MTYDTQADFQRAIDRRLTSVCGLDSRDLPDAVCIADCFYEGCDDRDVNDVCWEILDNADYPRDLCDALYETDGDGELVTS